MKVLIFLFCPTFAVGGFYGSTPRGLTPYNNPLQGSNGGARAPLPVPTPYGYPRGFVSPVVTPVTPLLPAHSSQAIPGNLGSFMPFNTFRPGSQVPIAPQPGPLKNPRAGPVPFQAQQSPANDLNQFQVLANAVLAGTMKHTTVSPLPLVTNRTPSMTRPNDETLTLHYQQE